MKPLNQKEINEKFFNFMILFIVCVAVFSFALYYDFAIPSSELKSLRIKNNNYENTLNRYGERYNIAEKKKAELDDIKSSGHALKPGESEAKAREINKIYVELEDSTNELLGIFKISRDLLLNDVADIEAATKQKQALDKLKSDLDAKTKEFDEFQQKVKQQDYLKEREGSRF